MTVPVERTPAQLMSICLTKYAKANCISKARAKDLAIQSQDVRDLLERMVVEEANRRSELRAAFLRAKAKKEAAKAKAARKPKKYVPEFGHHVRATDGRTGVVVLQWGSVTGCGKCGDLIESIEKPCPKCNVRPVVAGCDDIWDVRLDGTNRIHPYNQIYLTRIP